MMKWVHAIVFVLVCGLALVGLLSVYETGRELRQDFAFLRAVRLTAEQQQRQRAQLAQTPPAKTPAPAPAQEK